MESICLTLFIFLCVQRTVVRDRPIIMSFLSGTIGNEAAQKFLEVLQNDFRTLSNETKKKYPQIKEVSVQKEN